MARFSKSVKGKKRDVEGPGEWERQYSWNTTTLWGARGKRSN